MMVDPVVEIHKAVHNGVPGRCSYEDWCEDARDLADREVLALRAALERNAERVKKLCKCNDSHCGQVWDQAIDELFKPYAVGRVRLGITWEEAFAAMDADESWTHFRPSDKHSGPYGRWERAYKKPGGFYAKKFDIADNAAFEGA